MESRRKVQQGSLERTRHQSLISDSWISRILASRAKVMPFFAM